MDLVTAGLDSTSEELEKNLARAHDHLFGADSAATAVAVKAQIAQSMSEFPINVSISRKAKPRPPPSTPEAIVELALLLGDLFVSASPEVAVKPAVESYVQRMEDVLLPRLLHTAVTPSLLRGALLATPLRVFSCAVREAGGGGDPSATFMREVLEALREMRLNFGVDLLPFESFVAPAPPVAEDIIAAVHPPTTPPAAASAVAASSPNADTKSKSTSSKKAFPRAGTFRSVLPSYLVKRRAALPSSQNQAASQEEGNSLSCPPLLPMRDSNRETTPVAKGRADGAEDDDDDDGEILVGETPPKRFRYA